MSLEQIILGDYDMFGFGKRKETGLDLAKAQADPRFNQILNKVSKENPEMSHSKALRIALEQYRNLPQDPGRRDFMKKTAEVGIAAGLMSMGVLPEEANASWESENLPPGFQHLRPWADTLKRAYREYKGKNIKGAETILRLTGTQWYNQKPYPWISIETILCEPAYWYLVGEMLDLGKAGYSTILLEKKKITHMDNFAMGISGYFNYFEGKTNYSYSDVENYFLKSIFSAAGYEDYERRALRYQENKDLDYRTKIIKETYKKLDSLKHPKRLSKDPFNAYNRQLVAAWAATWLTNFYWSNVKKEKDQTHKNALLINHSLEIPLRKNIGFKIRGPPNYIRKDLY